jgi:serine/threonine protein kinase
VKPSNLIWSEDGVVKLIDFGLAQVANQPQELIGGLAYGTAAYLSPEQASGQPVGPASDTYSLGCVVYELLAGRPPFAREDGFESSERLLRAHLDEQPDPPSLVNPGRNIPGWADELVMWALLKRPDDRIRNPADLSHFFQLGAAGELTAVDVRRLRADGTPQPARQISDSSTAGAVGHSSVSIPRKKPLLLRIALPFQATLWRFVMAMAVANLFLAAVLYINRGSVPGLIDGESDLQAGSQARVTVADLNFRGEPGLSSPSMALLEKGTMVKITGHHVEADAEVWWPVSLESGGRTLMGYLWEGGIEPQDVSLRKRLDRALSNLWEDAKSAAGL